MPFLVNVTPVNPDCGCDGRIAYTYTGGTNPVRFIIKLNGVVVEDISYTVPSGGSYVTVNGSPLLCGGVYSIQANDGGVPTFLQVVTLVDVTPITLSIQTVYAPCNGQGLVNFQLSG